MAQVILQVVNIRNDDSTVKDDRGTHTLNECFIGNIGKHPYEIYEEIFNRYDLSYSTCEFSDYGKHPAILEGFIKAFDIPKYLIEKGVTCAEFFQPKTRQELQNRWLLDGNKFNMREVKIELEGCLEDQLAPTFQSDKCFILFEHHDIVICPKNIFLQIAPQNEGNTYCMPLEREGSIFPDLCTSIDITRPMPNWDGNYDLEFCKKVFREEGYISCDECAETLGIVNHHQEAEDIISL